MPWLGFNLESAPGLLANVAAGGVAKKKTIRVRLVPLLIPCAGLARGECFRLPDFDVWLQERMPPTPQKIIVVEQIQH